MIADRTEAVSRRALLAAGVATAGAWALGRPAAAADSPPGTYGPFKMGLQSYSLRGFKIAEAIQKTKDLGLTYWESARVHIPDGGAPDQVDALRKQVSDAGIRVLAHGVVPFTNDHDQNRALFEFGKRMGLTYFSADPAPDSFSSLDRLVEEYGIAIGIHNHGPTHRYGKIDTIKAAIADHHPEIGCCIDTGHFLRSREDPVRAVEVFGKRIFGVHLKDVKDAKTFTVLGKGDLRTVDLLKALASLKYDYCLALEYENNPADPIAEMKACLDEAKRAVAML